MDKKIDLTLYNQVKEKFTVAPGNMGLVVLSNDKIEDLALQVFPEANEAEYFKVMQNIWANDIPYAMFCHWTSELSYIYVCKEFDREENLITGKTVYFKLEPFKRLNLDNDLVRQDLAKLSNLLFGDSEVS